MTVKVVSISFSVEGFHSEGPTASFLDFGIPYDSFGFGASCTRCQAVLHIQMKLADSGTQSPKGPCRNILYTWCPQAFPYNYFKALGKGWAERASSNPK